MSSISSSMLFSSSPRPPPPPQVLRVSSLYTAKPSFSDSMATSAPKWAQKTITLPPHRRGCHLITPKILNEIGSDLSEFKCGLAHLFLHHTSASLTINENYDSDVRDDTETFLNKIVPEGRSAPWKHTLEGPDDMPAHIKSSMFGCSLTFYSCAGFQSLMESLIWALGREYGCVSTGTTLLRVKLWLPLMEYEELVFGFCVFVT
ncbi:uncharacterized protein LOC7474534 isoform X1 [Populus trichocarpa]|uniref:Uncharacterized protein n=1 Tax=Populus trichocarpa TaxID=3694 RepID=A0A3N7FXD6_POPTR|nr:uncharacterized protein LOC7474534 isoform X1 [Populus trichocarpa]|eukprot:XP_006386119.1 uncharacterized protein LOC7474534 isoform X1 [Populus trichocarpa]